MNLMNEGVLPPNELDDRDERREESEAHMEDVEELMREIDAALDVPPRNCDKYANHNDAMKAFEAFVREQGRLGFINPYTEAFKWLFAPAKEGGDK